MLKQNKRLHQKCAEGNLTNAHKASDALWRYTTIDSEQFIKLPKGKRKLLDRSFKLTTRVLRIQFDSAAPGSTSAHSDANSGRQFNLPEPGCLLQAGSLGDRAGRPRVAPVSCWRHKHTNKSSVTYATAPEPGGSATVGVDKNNNKIKILTSKYSVMLYFDDICEEA